MERILFLVPPTIDYDKFKSPPENVRTIPKQDGFYGSVITDMPLGVLALSAYLKEHNSVAIKMVDLNIALNKCDSFPYDSFPDYYKELLSQPEHIDFNPTMIGLSVLFTTSYQNMLDLATCCREIFPEALLFAGGGVPTNMYEQIFKDTDDFDALIYGEGEKPLSYLVSAPDKQEAIALHNAIITPGKAASNQPFSFDIIENLDQIPLYDYGLLNLSEYRLNPTISSYKAIDHSKPFVTYMGSRGCPFTCVFCAAHSVHGRKVRTVSLARIEEDFKRLAEDWGISMIVFQDDHFMASDERVFAILELLKKYKIQPFFQNSLTLFKLKRPILEAFKACGVSLLVLAIESGSERVLKEVMHKPLNLSTVKQVVNDCIELGIDTDVNIVVGLPGETPKDIEDTRSYLKALKATWFRIFAAVPLVGSELYEICIDKGYLKKSFLEGDYKTAVIETEDFTAAYIRDITYDLNLDLNFVSNGEMYRGNYKRALIDFHNTISVKEDHGFSYYFAALCYYKLGNMDKFVEYKRIYTKILSESALWQQYAKRFNLRPLPSLPEEL